MHGGCGTITCTPQAMPTTPEIRIRLHRMPYKGPLARTGTHAVKQQQNRHNACCHCTACITKAGGGRVLHKQGQIGQDTCFSSRPKPEIWAHGGAGQQDQSPAHSLPPQNSSANTKRMLLPHSARASGHTCKQHGSEAR
jgi:hypothetical protein